jgi:transcriptional regulator with XRE-family HTH domain
MARPGRRKRAESRYTEQAERLAARLRALREQRGMTQEQLAAQAAISVATVRNIERMAVVEPFFFTVLAIVRVLGTSITWPRSSRHGLAMLSSAFTDSDPRTNALPPERAPIAEFVHMKIRRSPPIRLYRSSGSARTRWKGSGPWNRSRWMVRTVEAVTRVGPD